MKNKPDPADSSLSETMAARIEIKELGDPAHQKKITDAVAALDGVIETKIEKGALHVSYDPLATTEKKIEQAIRSTGTTIKAAATDTEDAHPDLPTPNCTASSRPKCGPRRGLLTHRDFPGSLSGRLFDVRDWRNFSRSMRDFRTGIYTACDFLNNQTHFATAGERNQRQSARKITIIATSKTTAPTPRRIRMRFWFISTYTPRFA